MTCGRKLADGAFVSPAQYGLLDFLAQSARQYGHTAWANVDQRRTHAQTIRRIQQRGYAEFQRIAEHDRAMRLTESGRVAMGVP